MVASIVIFPLEFLAHNSLQAALAKILHEATAASASAFKARGIPEALRVVEVMGIEQARKWGTCSVSQITVWLAAVS